MLMHLTSNYCSVDQRQLFGLFFNVMDKLYKILAMKSDISWNIYYMSLNNWLSRIFLVII